MSDAPSSRPVDQPSPAAAPLPQTRADFLHAKEALFAQVLGAGASTRGLQDSLSALSAATDTVLRQLWHWAAMPQDWALLAVGGYGRGELFPHSDVDVLVLLPDGLDVPDAAAQARLEAFISGCWDTGLEIGASVRTVAHSETLARADLTAQTAMLEARLVEGEPARFAAFAHAIRALTDPAAFFVAKVLEMR